MYAAQQSSIDPALAALMQTAQMVTPDNTPTVAAQVAQAAKQKMAPQGIAQGMPEAQEDFQAAMPSMMRNMQQQQMQRMVEQAMQPQPAGIEGLPAPNMQNMAEGGVVGYAGNTDGSQVKLDEQAEQDRARIAQLLRDIRDQGLVPAGAAIADVATAIPRGLAGAYNSTVVRAMRAAGLPAAYLPDIAGGDLSSKTPFYDKYVRQPEAKKAAEAEVPYSNEERRAAAPAPQPAPSSQPRSQPRPQAVPQAAQPAAGIEQLVKPKFRGEGIATAGQGAMTEAQDTVKRLRDIEEARAAAKGKMPDLNERGIAALQRAEAERKRLAEIDRSDDERRRWAGVFRGWGGDRDAYDRILTGIASRDSAANQAQLQFDQAQIKLQQAQQAEALGQFDRKAALEKEAAELMTKARKNALDAQQIAANLATSQFATEANLFNTKSSAQQRGLDRVQQAQIEGAKLKQQAEQNNQMKLANLINSANITVNSAIEKMEKTLANKYGAMINIINTMTPEMLQKQPQMAATYDAYLKDKDALYKQTVEPAVMQRNRLATQITGGQDLSQWGEPTVKKGG
jgi:hypothetical protein